MRSSVLALVLGSLLAVHADESGSGDFGSGSGSSSPPPPPPPSPSMPPGAPGAISYTEYSSVVTMVAEGQVSEFTTTRIQSIQAILANAAGVSVDRVIVRVSAGSVVIQAKIILTSQVAADDVTSTLSAQLNTPDSASTFLSGVDGGGVTVLSAPVVVAATEQKVTYPPPPPPPPPPSPLPISGSNDGGMDGGAIAGVVIGSLLGAAALAALVIYCQKSKGKRDNSKGDPAGVSFANVGAGMQENV